MVHIDVRERTYTIVQTLGVPLTITAWTTLSLYMVHSDARKRTYTSVYTMFVNPVTTDGFLLQDFYNHSTS